MFLDYFGTDSIHFDEVFGNEYRKAACLRLGAGYTIEFDCDWDRRDLLSASLAPEKSGRSRDSRRFSTMRRFPLGLVVVLGALGLASEARAQVPFTNINDPFFAYYSFYLPRQQALANQPGPEATIATITANRQAGAATNRNEFFDNSASGLNTDFGDFSPNSGVRTRSTGPRTSRIGGNLNGLGPAGYYNNASTRSYHPTIRPGITKNNNVSVIRGRGYSGGGGYGAGAGFGGIGLPGPR